jgi:hypothetical protein
MQPGSAAKKDILLTTSISSELQGQVRPADVVSQVVLNAPIQHMSCIDGHSLDATIGAHCLFPSDERSALLTLAA